MISVKKFVYELKNDLKFASGVYDLSKRFVF